jgi:hypothetical protein
MIKPEVPEKRPYATIRCDGECCGGEGDCQCGETCGCGSTPGTPKRKDRVKLVDYSGMVRKNIILLVDYNSVSDVRKNVRTSMR